MATSTTIGNDSALRRAIAWLPRGSALPPEEWGRRHRVMVLVLLCQLPLIVGYGLVTGQSLGHTLVDAFGPAVLCAIAFRPGPRLARAGAVVLGLVSSSAIFVHLSGGLIEWHFHFFVVLALVSLYQEWRIYLIALAFVVIEHVLADLVLPVSSVYNHGAGEWWWALVHGAFVLSASACHIASWRFSEGAHARALELEQALTEGEASLLARTQQVARMRTDLIATASHEFRTPITAIKVAVSVLDRHGDRLTADERGELVAAIAHRSDGLAAMLENMLLALRVEPSVLGSYGPLLLSFDEMAVQLPAGLVAPHAQVPADLAVACHPDAVRSLFRCLVDGTGRFGLPGAELQVAARAESGEVVVIESSVETGAHPATVDGLLEAFQPAAQRDGAADVGLSLFVARRIVEADGGSLSAHLVDGRLVVRATLPRAYRTRTPMRPLPEQGSGRISEEAQRLASR